MQVGECDGCCYWCGKTISSVNLWEIRIRIVVVNVTRLQRLWVKSTLGCLKRYQSLLLGLPYTLIVLIFIMLSEYMHLILCSLTLFMQNFIIFLPFPLNRWFYWRLNIMNDKSILGSLLLMCFYGHDIDVSFILLISKILLFLFFTDLDLRQSWGLQLLPKGASIRPLSRVIDEQVSHDHPLQRLVPKDLSKSSFPW
jgi:hypothetical protein